MESTSNNGIGEKSFDCKWVCDKCGAHLNLQLGFEQNTGEWVCRGCGHMNDISRIKVSNGSHSARSILDKIMNKGNFSREIVLNENEARKIRVIIETY